MARRVTESMKFPNESQFKPISKLPVVFGPHKNGSEIIYDKIRITADCIFSNRKLADSWVLVKIPIKSYEIIKMVYVKT